MYVTSLFYKTSETCKLLYKYLNIEIKNIKVILLLFKKLKLIVIHFYENNLFNSYKLGVIE